jgi:hypothetical protein
MGVCETQCGETRYEGGVSTLGNDDFLHGVSHYLNLFLGGARGRIYR